MVRIEIRNFQSIAHIVLEVDGFSALVGRSNIGKSAVVRAIKAALTGAPVDGYVRHSLDCQRITKGAKSCKCFCSVHIKSDDLDLLWEKGDSVNQYHYNGSNYTVVGRGTPDFLAQNFAPVKIGDEKEIIQVSDQFRPIFILDRSGTVVADVLSDVAKLDQINEATHSAEKDRKETASTRKVREQDVLSIQSSLLFYDGLDKIADQVVDLETFDCQTNDISIKVDQLERFIEIVFDLIRKVKNLEQANLITISSIDSIIVNGGAFIQLEKFIFSLESKVTATSLLEGADLVETPNIDPFLNLGLAYDKLIPWVLKSDLLNRFFSQFETFDSVTLPVLDTLIATKGNYFQLNSWVTQVMETSQVVLGLKNDLEFANKDMTGVLEEFKSLGVCYACGRHFEGKQCLE